MIAMHPEAAKHKAGSVRLCFNGMPSSSMPFLLGKGLQQCGTTAPGLIFLPLFMLKKYRRWGWENGQIQAEMNERCLFKKQLPQEKNS